jgi:hypothetical protein
LTLQGFTRLKSDANIYIKREKDEGFTILTVYVDDCIIVSNNTTLIQQVKDILQHEFDMFDEGEIHYTLGNAITRN